MFETIKTGNIKGKLIKLIELYEKLTNDEYNKTIEDFIPNIKKYEIKYTFLCSSRIITHIGFTFKIDNITYGFEERNFVYIKVNDIVIYHNRDEYSCDGLFEGVQRGWNHKLSKVMLKQIKQDSYIVDKCIKDIENYITYNRGDTKGSIKHMKEQKELNRIFK